MTDTVSEAGPRAPVHLWIVGVLGLLWNAFGAFDYFMTRTQRAAWIDQMMPGVDSQRYMAYIDGFPIWVSIAWGLGVWGGLVGVILLLMRKRIAVPTLLVSFLGALLGVGWQLINPVDIPEMTSGANAVVPYIVIVFAAVLYLYARAQAKRGLLG
jgi:hypothetical protein